MRPRLTITLAFLVSALLMIALPRGAAAAPASGTAVAPSSAVQSVRDACSLTGLVPAHGSSCPAGDRLRRQWLGIPALPNPVHVVKKVVGGVASTAIKTVALVAILGWVASGAESALKETAKVIDDTTSPQLTSDWFSASYWRVAGIAALLTLPFLCAASIHALVRSDLGLLTRAACGYLPLSLLAVGVASQLTMLLLAGTDEMSAIVASASAHADSVFLSTTSVTAIAESVATADPFVTFLAAIVTVAATLALWLELLLRNAAVYVIVLMLPLFFAAMVWPARRILAIRAIETLIALIVSKFAIVAVLSLGGSALGHSTIPGAASVLTGGTLVLLAAFTPWALLRMLPLHELASAAAGGLSHTPRQTLATAARTAVELGDGLVTLGADRIGRTALPTGEPSILGGGSRGARGSAGHVAPEPGLEHGPAQPVDADVAAPVTGAMSGAAGADGQIETATATVPGAAPDDAPGSQPAAAELDHEVAGSAAGQPAVSTGAFGRWPEMLAFPGRTAGDEPQLSLGADLLALGEQRRSVPKPHDDDEPASAPATGAPSPAPEPPVLPPPPKFGFDPLDGGDT